MYMKNVETLNTTMGHQQASWQKKEQEGKRKRKEVDLSKCVQMYRTPFLYLPGAPNSLNPPLKNTVICLKE